MTFIEKLSCIFGKQYLFKDRKDVYYNKWTCTFQSKKESQEWLIEALENEIESEKISRGIK